MGVGVTAEFGDDGRERIRGARARDDFCRALSFFEGAHVTANGEAGFDGAVIFEGVDLVFQYLDVGNECGLSFGAREEGIGGADRSAGGGERGCFNSGHALIWFLPHVSVLKSDAVSVQIIEILYRWGPFFPLEVMLSHATSSVSVKWELAYILLTNITTFLLSEQGTPIAMAASELRVSSRVYFVMWRLGVSSHSFRRVNFASTFSWLSILHQVVPR